MTREALSYQGVYINLERSTARRARMEAQLAQLKLTDLYVRFPAVDGAKLPLPGSKIGPGETGAFLSHMRVLEEARQRGLPLHVLEDDALLCAPVRPVIGDVIASGLLDRFDIVFTDTLLMPHLGMLKGLKAEFDRVMRPQTRPLCFADLKAIDLKRENFSCLTSYVVGAGAMDRILALYRAELARGPLKPVDLFLRDCVADGRLRAGLLFPFVTSFRLDEVAPSTVAAGTQNAKPSVMVLAVLRYLFFVERDLVYAKSCLDAVTQQNRRKSDPHHDLMVQALEFVLSADFQPF
ncbi:MAG TPA: glycosyltransferase family 25 protein [Micropepsaceae bacterium]|jgi:GR25 family glycosyltransferase involved in LPS biosynthesis